MASLRKKISSKIKNRYRLIIRNDENLLERFSLVLTPLNLLILTCVGLFVFGSLVFVMLAYTPLNHLFPTKSSKYSMQEQYELLQRIDSLETSLNQVKLQSNILSKILAGEDVDVELPPRETTPEPAIETPAEVEPAVSQRPEEQVIQVVSTTAPLTNRSANAIPQAYSFFRPLKGIVSDTFNTERKHLAIDIAAKKKAVIKSIQKGSVIFSDWTPGGGHTLVLQHPNEFVSVYKHNAVLLKKVGTFVNAGDAIALVGNSGEHTTGPHLHFELWHKGIPVNPKKYISF